MNILVLGAGGFIGGHLCKRLKDEGHTVTGVDIKFPEHWNTRDICTYFVQEDLRICDIEHLLFAFGPVDEVYQLAADMGGAGYIFTGEHDADIMHNSATINLRVLDACRKNGKVGRIFYSSSACIYPGFNQEDPNNPNCKEDSAYPSQPDSEYGWEKIFSERLYKSYERNYGIKVRIARFHNIFGPYGTWCGGKEKAPAAICRKVIEATAHVEIWGDGTATRSFLYIDECIDGVLKLMRSDCTKILNIGSSEMVSIGQLAKMAIGISGKDLDIHYIPGPVGVKGRNSHNALIEQELGWKPTRPLIEGLEKTYAWIKEQVEKNGKNI